MCEWRTIARSPTGSGSRTADRQEVERAIQVAAVGYPEVRRRDRRHEARVEGLGQPQRRMDAVPARAQRELVRAELAGVEDAVDLDAGEVRLEQPAVLG